MATALISIALILGGLWYLLEQKVDEVLTGMVTNPHGIMLPGTFVELETPHQFLPGDTADFGAWDPRVARWCSDAVIRLEISSKNDTTLTIPRRTKILKKFTDLEYAPGKKVFMMFLTLDENPDMLVLVIRGTLTQPEWEQDLRLSMVPAKILGSNGTDYYKDIMIHNGFNTVYSEMRDSLINVVKNFSDKPFSLLVAGHSLGAAMTTLASIDFTTNVPNVKRTLVYVYGSPRVGNAAFADFIKSKTNLTIHRVVNNSDFFTEVPPAITPNISNDEAPYPYTHVGDEHSFNINHFSILANHNLPIYNVWLDNVIKNNVPDSEQHK